MSLCRKVLVLLGNNGQYRKFEACIKVLGTTFTKQNLSTLLNSLELIKQTNPSANLQANLSTSLHGVSLP